MMPTKRTCLTAALVLAGLVPGVTRAQDAFQSALPAGTSIYVGAADIPSAIEGFKTSALYKIWKAEETQEFLADLLLMLEQQYAQGLKQAQAMHQAGVLPVAPEKLEKLRLHGMHFALTDLELPTQENPLPRVGIVVSFDFGDSAGIAKEVIGAVLPMAMAEMKKRMGERAPEPQTQEVAGSTLTTLPIPESRGVVSLNWGFAGSQLLIGTDTARVSAMIKAMAEGGDGGFLGGKLYRTGDSKIGGRPVAFEMYVDCAHLMQRVMEGLSFASKLPQMQNEDVDLIGIQRAIQASGVMGIEGFGMRTGWENGKAFVDSFMMIPKGARKGLAALLAGGAPLDLKRLAWVPQDVGSFSLATTAQLSELYDAIMNAVKAYDPNAHKFAEAQLARLKERSGIDVAGLIGSMGGSVFYYDRPVTGLMAAPEMVIGIGCSQPEVMLTQLKKLTSLSEGMVEIVEDKIEDQTIYGLNLTLGGGGFDPSAILDPAFAFVEGHMVFALNRPDLKQALARINGRATTPDIRKHPEFSKYMELIPEGATAIGYVDMKATIQGLYGPLSTAIQFADIPPDIPIDLGLLPQAETITDPLFGNISWQVTDDSGVVGRMVGPMGPEYLGLAVAAVAGVGVFAIAQSRQMGAIRRR